MLRSQPTAVAFISDELHPRRPVGYPFVYLSVLSGLCLSCRLLRTSRLCENALRPHLSGHAERPAKSLSWGSPRPFQRRKFAKPSTQVSASSVKTAYRNSQPKQMSLVMYVKPNGT